MPDLEDAIYTQLTNHAGLAALVALRIFPGRLPEDVEYPAIYYDMDSGGDGPVEAMGGETGLEVAGVMVHVYDDDFDRGKNTMRQVIGTKAIAGALKDWSVVDGNLTVQRAFRQGRPIQLYEQGPKVYHWLARYRIWFVEA